MEKQNKKNGTFGRLLRYIYKNYRVYMITVIICIIIAANRGSSPPKRFTSDSSRFSLSIGLTRES